MASCGTGNGGSDNSFIGGLFDNITQTIKDGINAILTPIKEIIKAITDFYNYVKTMPKTIIDGIKAYFKNVVDFIMTLPNVILTNIKDALTWAFVPDKNLFISRFQELQDKFNSKFPNANVNFLKGLEAKDTVPYVPSGGNIVSLEDGIKVDVSPIRDNVFIYYRKYQGTFQAWISGFIYLLLGIYNYNQILYLIRGSSPVGATILGTDVMADTRTELRGRKLR